MINKKYFKLAIKTLLCLCVISTFYSCSNGTKKAHAVAQKVKGKPVIIRNGQTILIHKDTSFYDDDIIVTKQDEALVLDFRDGMGQMEVQPECKLKISDFSKKEKKIHLLKGNVWTKISKMKRGGTFHLHTPEAVAGVRGTKFYTFSAHGITGTCHCQGDVDYNHRKTGYKGAHKQDDLVVTKEGRTILITAAELKANVGIAHDHSVLNESPLGNSIDHEREKRLIDYLLKRFKEVQ